MQTRDEGDRSAAGRDFPDLCAASGALGAARWCLSSRTGGVSTGVFAQANLGAHVGDDPEAVTSNRTAFAAALGAESGLAVIRAEHGARVGEARVPGDVPHVDALLTDQRGLGLLALGADCAVVGLHGLRSDGTSLIGVAHCGWRGLVADVLGAVVAALRDRGADHMQAVIGPAICGRCYVVPKERIDHVRQACPPQVADAAITEVQGECGLDISAGATARLETMGVRVIHAGGCTFENEDWFSFRRSGQTGRQGLGVVIP